MKDLTYRITYTGGRTVRSAESELVRVSARDINSGFSKALRKAKEPLGSGAVREIARVEFWEVH